MSRNNPSRDRYIELLGEMLNEQRRGKEDRSRIEQGIEGLRRDVGSLLGLPERIAGLERLTEANHAANVRRLNAIEGDVRSLQSWRAERDGMRKGVVIGVSAASAIGGGGLGAGFVALLRKWGFL